MRHGAAGSPWNAAQDEPVFPTVQDHALRPRVLRRRKGGPGPTPRMSGSQCFRPKSRARQCCGRLRPCAGATHCVGSGFEGSGGRKDHHVGDVAGPRERVQNARHGSGLIVELDPEDWKVAILRHRREDGGDRCGRLPGALRVAASGIRHDPDLAGDGSRLRRSGQESEEEPKDPAVLHRRPSSRDVTGRGVAGAGAPTRAFQTQRPRLSMTGLIALPDRMSARAWLMSSRRYLWLTISPNGYFVRRFRMSWRAL